jgi:hypothetical protein
LWSNAERLRSRLSWRLTGQPTCTRFRLHRPQPASKHWDVATAAHRERGIGAPPPAIRVGRVSHPAASGGLQRANGRSWGVRNRVSKPRRLSPVGSPLGNAKAGTLHSAAVISGCRAIGALTIQQNLSRRARHARAWFCRRARFRPPSPFRPSQRRAGPILVSVHGDCAPSSRSRRVALVLSASPPSYGKRSKDSEQKAGVNR